MINNKANNPNLNRKSRKRIERWSRLIGANVPLYLRSYNDDFLALKANTLVFDTEENAKLFAKPFTASKKLLGNGRIVTGTHVTVQPAHMYGKYSLDGWYNRNNWWFCLNAKKLAMNFLRSQGLVAMIDMHGKRHEVVYAKEPVLRQKDKEWIHIYHTYVL